MPLYFLHLTEADEVVHDPEGIDRDDLAAVQRDAIEGAAGLIGDALIRGDRDYRGRLDVAAADGAALLTMNFACQLRVERPPPDSV